MKTKWYVQLLIGNIYHISMNTDNQIIDGIVSDCHSIDVHFYFNLIIKWIYFELFIDKIHI